MSRHLNCQEIVDRHEEIVDEVEVWSVKMTSSDGEDSEISFPEGEVEARRHQSAFGGQLWVRRMYVTAGHPAEDTTPEELMDMMQP